MTDGTSITEVASLEHDTDTANSHSLVHATGDIYVLAYRGAGSDGQLVTFSISADGTSINELATLEHDTNNASSASLVQVDDDTFALAYQRNNGRVKTFSVSADGMSISEVEQVTHNSAAHASSFVRVDADTFALAYRVGGATITTFTILADGTISSVDDEFTHDTSSTGPNYNSLVQVNETTFALAFIGEDDDGFLRTFDIRPDKPEVEITVVGGNPTNALLVEHVFEFSEPVTGFDAGDLWPIRVSGSVTPSLLSLTGSGSSYSATVDVSSGQGEYRLDLIDDDSIVGSVTSEPFLGTGTGTIQGEVVEIIRSMPQVLEIAVSGANPTPDTNVAFDVVFDRVVTGVVPESFSLSPTLAGATVQTVEDLGATQRVTVGGYTENGDLGLVLADGTGITDLASNSLDLSNLPFSDEVATVLRGSLSGFVYEDTDLDGTKDPEETFFFAGVEITLTGTDDLGASVNVTTTTSAVDGSFLFDDLRPGTYSLSEGTVAADLDGDETVGSLVGARRSTTSSAAS